MKQIPNILTLGNLFCGVLAILFTLHTPAFLSGYNGQTFLITAPPPIIWGSVAIGVAAIFDFLDGFAARLLHVQSPLGVQLDSLADLVTFGVAPAMMLYYLLKHAYMMQPDAMEVSLFRLAPVLLLPCFTAYRLGRFNISTTSSASTDFTGVPAPAVGILVASLPLVFFYHQYPVAGWLMHPWIIYILTAVLCFLMVSRIPFFSLKVKNLSVRGNLLRYILLLLTIVSIPVLHWAAVSFCFFLYVILSIGRFWFAPGKNI